MYAQGQSLSEARSRLEEADSQKARLAVELEALRQEARQNQDTALDAFEKLSERQKALEALEQVRSLFLTLTGGNPLEALQKVTALQPNKHDACAFVEVSVQVNCVHN